MEPTIQKFQNKYRIPSARANWHDYNGGTYFITICTKNREHFFGEIDNGEMVLSEIGKYVDICIKNIETLHENVYVPIYQIMPDHIHLIIIMDNPVETPHCDVSTNGTKNVQMQNIANKCGKLSHIISRFKFVVTRFARATQPYFAWQTRYYDRIIRNQYEMNCVAGYIEHNVAKWNEGCEVDY
ncbi:MAG: hypothetical protein IJT45_09780 [Bacteroidales bacterium]|nr:hypothetical protein [Bacteroidales bacterium]